MSNYGYDISKILVCGKDLWQVKTKYVYNAKMVKEYKIQSKNNYLR